MEHPTRLTTASTPAIRRGGWAVEHVGLDDLGGGQRQQVAGTVAAAGRHHQGDPAAASWLATAVPTKPLPPPTIRTLRGYMLGLR